MSILSYRHSSRRLIHSMFGISTTRLGSYRAIHSRLQDFAVIHFRSVSSSRDVIAAGSFSFLPREDSFESLPLPPDISDPSRFRSLHFRSPYPRVPMSFRAALHFLLLCPFPYRSADCFSSFVACTCFLMSQVFSLCRSALASVL